MSPYPATRRNGVCTGSLWKSHSRFRGSSASTTSPVNSVSSPAPGLDSPDPAVSLDDILAEANERQRAHEFCVLVGNIMWSYSDVWAYAKGDPPTSEIRIVGASAWNPPSRARSASRRLTLSPHVTSTNTNSVSLEGNSLGASTSLKSPDFLIVTYCGTHVRCSAPTSLDKEEWLAALHSGLEGSILENRIETLMVLSNKQRDRSVEFSRRRSDDSETESNSGGTNSQNMPDRMVQSAIASASSAFEAEISSRPILPPLPRVEVRQLKKLPSALVDDSSATPFHSELGGNVDSASDLPLTGYTSPCDDCSSPPSDTHCFACGRYPPGHAMRIDASPLPEYGMEVRVDLCHDCSIAEGVLRHVRYLEGLYEADARDRAAIRMAWDDVKEVVERQKWENAGLEIEKPMADGTQNGRNHDPAESEKSIPGTPNVVLDAFLEDALLELVCNENFLAYRLSSNSIDSLCKDLEDHRKDCAQHFIESVEECAQAACDSCFFAGKHDLAPMNNSERTNEAIFMKKESFKVAGDMSAALKLLYQYALPSESRNLPPTSHLRCSRLRDDADMLVAILEFFLDLCEQGQIDAIAFFWPQLCHIHMQMLPPRDTEEMIRVELMEDFLLTVSIRYSVHLALDLVWGLTADLEEGLGSSTSNSITRRRCFAILRFVSELESLLFDFEGGWGGGGVSLRGMLLPTQHQATLLRDTMSLVQLRRRFGSHFLTRSVRLDNLRVEAMERLEHPPSHGDKVAIKGLIAQNAAYFSSQIAFARKLGDIAEKLRFMKVEKRSEALRRELKEINDSDKLLGGDPLNRMCKSVKFQKTVHLPIDEGHVFRSKARTPVLLLAELVGDPPEPTSVKDQNDINTTGTLSMQNDDLDPNGGRKLESDSPSQRFLASPSTKIPCNDQDKNEAEADLCPETPSRHPPVDSSTTSPGCLTSQLLSLTPKASEATDVTHEGKEMMADMIATLITSSHRNLLVPSIDESFPDIDGNHATEVQIHPNTTALTNDGCECSVVIRSNPGPNETTDDITSSEAKRDDTRKISALGSVLQVKANLSSADFSKSSGIHQSADGQFRRDVLFAIMERGMRGNNIIAKGAATAARRAIQSMDRKRAIALMNEPSTDTELSERKSVKNDISINASADEGEVVEALRLLIIQNQVAHENLSTENPAKSHRTRAGSAEVDTGAGLTNRSQKGVDAGEVDHRLAGCGRISTSVLSALRLWKGGIVSNGELLVLVHKDLQFLKQSAVFGSTDEKILIEDSAFWGRFSYGERWAEKKARLAASSPFGSLPDWNLIGFIVKSNDDLRQEAFVMQLIVLCEEAFRTAGLDLWVHPYRIVATGLSTGIIECVKDAMSFDSLKKRPGYGSDGLVGHFQRMTEIAADPFKSLNEAKQNFVSSLAAYSLMSYLFMFKDRHNGNLLLDTAGHVIHIDFGFVFGTAPGGSFSLEQSTPFKLTDEMLEVMGGIGSPLFSEFVTLFCCGFLALQAHADTFLTVVEVTCRGSNFNCFEGKDPGEVVSKLRERFCPDLNKSQTVAYALDLIKFATASYGTKQYDYYQYLSQGIAT